MITLCIEYPADLARHIAFEQCLERNLDCRSIDRVIVLSKGNAGPQSHANGAKLVRITTERSADLRPLTFNDFVAQMNARTMSPDDINIIARSDIYFDDTVDQLKQMDLEGICLALTPWDALPDGKAYPQLWDTTQDCWLFQGHIRPVRDLDFTLQTRGNDLRLAGELRAADYRVINPSLTIKAYRFNSSNAIGAPTQITMPHSEVRRCTLAEAGVQRHRASKVGVISLSLFGNKPKYVVGAVDNARLVKHIYPGWVIRYYVDDTVPPPILHQLLDLGAEIIAMPRGAGMSGLFWRFLAADDQGLARWMIRDADSRLNYRERRAVDEWIESGLPFHTMRDHPHHTRPIMGCAFGAVCGALSNMHQTIARWSQKGRYGDDEQMLAEIVYPVVKDSMLVHDSFAKQYNDKVKQFPSERENLRFVGERMDSEGRPHLADRNALINSLTARPKDIGLPQARG